MYIEINGGVLCLALSA